MNTGSEKIQIERMRKIFLFMHFSCKEDFEIIINWYDNRNCHGLTSKNRFSRVPYALKAVDIIVHKKHV